MATIANIYIDQGADWQQTMIVADEEGTKDLSITDIQGSIKKTYQSLSSVDFTVTKSFDVLSGEIVISLTNTQTKSMEPGRYVYDVIVTDTTNGNVTRIVEGQAIVNAGVTGIL